MLSCKVALLWINTSFPHLLLHQSPHEMSPSSSEYHIATLGSDDDCDDVIRWHDGDDDVYDDDCDDGDDYVVFKH